MKTTTIKKVFELGKIAYEGNRKINRVTIQAELKNNDQNQPCFTASGNIWNGSNTDIVCGGQMIDEILELLPNNETVKSLHRLWKLYHLNDLNAGTVKQTEAIDSWVLAGNKYEYNEACNYLKNIGLYVDGGYQYGTAWIYFPIPENDLQEIISLLT